MWHLTLLHENLLLLPVSMSHQSEAVYRVLVPKLMPVEMHVTEDAPASLRCLSGPQPVAPPQTAHSLPACPDN